MNTIATFRKCTLTDEQLLRAVDQMTDEMYKTGKIPSRCIPARPNEDYDLLVGELILRYEGQNKALPIHSVMQAEGSDGVSGAAVGNSAAGQSGSEGVMKWCDSCGKITKWIDGDCENYKTRGGSDKGALPR